MTLGEKIKTYRLKKNLTQAELAERLNVAKQTVFKYETGIVTNIPSDKIEALANIFGISPATLAVAEYAETLDFPDEIDADVLLRCKGDSMTPTYQDGDFVFIRRQPSVENGQIAAVYVKNGAEWDATLKKVLIYPEKNMIILRALNADYEDMIFTGEERADLEVYGLAVAIYRKT